jgi:REP element-mobilizing transposase RayT
VFHRADLRLRRFDYSNDRPYFITVCTHRRRCVLGRVKEDHVSLGELGQIVHRQLTLLPQRLHVHLDASVVMPNHVHAIVVLEARARQASPLRLGDVVGSFKSGSAREAGTRLWQRGYHDHVVRDELDLERVREYIATNPSRWALDPENPARSS